MKATRKPVNLHQEMLSKGFTLEEVVRTHNQLPKQIREYVQRVEWNEIDTFAVIPGELVPQARPRKLSREYFKTNSYAIYVKPSE